MGRGADDATEGQEESPVSQHSWLASVSRAAFFFIVDI